MRHGYRVIVEYYNIIIIKLDEDSNVVGSLTIPLSDTTRFLDQLNDALEAAEGLCNKSSPIFNADNFARNFFDN